MPNMIYHNQNGLLKPIKRHPFVVQLNKQATQIHPGALLNKKKGQWISNL